MHSFRTFIYSVLNVILKSGFLLFAYLCSGCVTQSSTSQIFTTYNYSKHHLIRIESCINKSSYTGKQDIASKATKFLSDRIDNSQFFGISTDSQLILICNIEHFEEGNAFKRWFLPFPRWGVTKAEVSVKLIDKQDDKILASFRNHPFVKDEARRVVLGRIAYGADSYSLGRALDDIIHQMEIWASEENNEFP